MWGYQTTVGDIWGSGSNVTGLSWSTDESEVWMTHQNHRFTKWVKSAGVWPSSPTLTLPSPSATSGSAADRLYYPGGISVSTDRLRIWIADSSNHRIAHWKSVSGTWTAQTPIGATQFNKPNDVHVTADESTMYVADTYNSRISVWVQSAGVWSASYTFGSNGAGAEQLNLPRGIAISPDECTMYVADTLNNRVSVWTRTSTSSTSWSNLTTFGGSSTDSTVLQQPAGLEISSDGLTLWVCDGHETVVIWKRPNVSSTSWSVHQVLGAGGNQPQTIYSTYKVNRSADNSRIMVTDSGCCDIWGVI